MRWLIFLTGILFLCNSVLAISGVSPGSYEVDFSPNLSRTFEFNFIFDDNSKAELYADGPLKDYVTLDKDSITGSEKVLVSLNLPETINTPGENVIRIGARQLVRNSNGVGIAADIGGIIKVNVPYPGRYAELEVIAPNANAGELVNITLKAYNRGKEDITLKPMIQIFNESGKLENLDALQKTIPVFSEHTFYFGLDTSDYSPGNYTVTALGDYNAETFARDDDLMRLGELRLEILDYTPRFDEDTISRFEIKTQSFYNNPIENVYAEVYILQKEWIRFNTPSEKIKAWGIVTLTGFLDTETIDTDPFMANVTLYYENTSTSHILALNLNKKTDYTILFYIITTILILSFIIWRIYIFIQRTGKKS